jgi:hypothetical protein
MIIKFIISVVFVEAITELLVKSKIFNPIRQKLIGVSPDILGDLLRCGYCFSFWVSAIFVPIFSVRLLFNNNLGIIIAIFIVHRCASHLHDITHIYVKHEPEEEKIISETRGTD